MNRRIPVPNDPPWWHHAAEAVFVVATFAVALAWLFVE
jgi:hypothetical protein